MGLVERSILKEGVVQITLNDPTTLNAMSEEMAAQFADTIAAIKSEAILPRVVVLAGAGKAFTAGGHLSMLAEKKKLSAEQNRSKMLDFYHAFLAIRSLPVPTIAKIHGAAIGAGLCLATACDFRVAAEGAKLGATFAKIGLYPGMGATYLLPRLLGKARAEELLITGRTLIASDAYNYGLVSKVVSIGELDAEVLKLCDEIIGSGGLTVQRLIENSRSDDVPSLEQALQREATLQAESYASEDFAKRLKALGG